MVRRGRSGGLAYQADLLGAIFQGTDLSGARLAYARLNQVRVRIAMSLKVAGSIAAMLLLSRPLRSWAELLSHLTCRLSSTTPRSTASTCEAPCSGNRPTFVDCQARFNPCAALLTVSTSSLGSTTAPLRNWIARQRRRAAPCVCVCLYACVCVRASCSCVYLSA